jgi:hypothetical protein
LGEEYRKNSVTRGVQKGGDAFGTFSTYHNFGGVASIYDANSFHLSVLLLGRISFKFSLFGSGGDVLPPFFNGLLHILRQGGVKLHKLSRFGMNETQRFGM